MQFLYINLAYYVLAILPGFTMMIFMAMSFLKYRNLYLGLFLLSYVGTGIMTFSFLYKLIHYYFTYIISPKAIFLEMFSMLLIIEGLTWLVVQVFYEKHSRLISCIVFLIGLVPIAFYLLIDNFFDYDIRLVYNYNYLFFFIVLGINCLVFALNYKKISDATNRKLGLLFSWLLFAFLLIFVFERFDTRFNIDFNPLPAFFFLWSVLLIWFSWKNIFVSGLNKLFYVQRDFVERYSITEREEEIIKLILEGKKNSLISKHLFISEKTVTNHIYNIYKKLDISSRFELICLFKD